MAAQHPQHIEKLQCFLGRQDGCGLIKNQNFCAPVQRLEDFQPLPVPYRQIADRFVQIDMQPGALHQDVKLGAHLRLSTGQQPVRLSPEQDVVQSRKRVHQHEVLVHHAKP